MTFSLPPRCDLSKVKLYTYLKETLKYINDKVYNNKYFKFNICILLLRTHIGYVVFRETVTLTQSEGTKFDFTLCTSLFS